MTRALMHFGVVRKPVDTHPADGDPLPLPQIDGHDDPSTEHEFAVGASRRTAYVSGSWACWGPADQATDGDESLHVVVEVDDVAALTYDEIRESLTAQLSADSRLLDFALVTDEGWSVETHVIVSTWNHTGVYEARAVDASEAVRVL